MATAEERLAAIQKKKAELTARENAIKARLRTAAAKAKRSADTRRKVLIGSMVLARIERSDADRRSLARDLDDYLSRPDDRALFADLLPQADPAPGPEPVRQTGAVGSRDDVQGEGGREKGSDLDRLSGL